MGDTLKIKRMDAVDGFCDDAVTMNSQLGMALGGLVQRVLRRHPDGIVLHCEGEKAKRSISQNSFQWVILQAIANASDEYDVQQVHDMLLVKRYGWRLVKLGDIEVPRMPQTKKFSVQQMADWLEWLLAWCADEGVKVGMPPEYQKWLEEINR